MLSRETMVRLAWAQIVAGTLSVPFFVAPLTVSWKVAIMGVITGLTWVGTGLGHLAAAWAARDLEDES